MVVNGRRPECSWTARGTQAYPRLHSSLPTRQNKKRQTCKAPANTTASERISRVLWYATCWAKAPLRVSVTDHKCELAIAKPVRKTPRPSEGKQGPCRTPPRPLQDLAFPTLRQLSAPELAGSFGLIGEAPHQ